MGDHRLSMMQYRADASAEEGQELREAHSHVERVTVLKTDQEPV